MLNITQTEIQLYPLNFFFVFACLIKTFIHLILNKINKSMFWLKHANTWEYVSEQSWLSGWNVLNILAHLTHLAQSYFCLIFSAINTYNCFWFDQTNKKDCSDWTQKLGEKWPMITTFFLTETAAITGITRICSVYRPPSI